MKFLRGKKTYITAAVMALLAGAEGLGVNIPLEAYVILGAFGLTTARRATGRVEDVVPYSTR